MEQDISLYNSILNFMGMSIEGLLLGGTAFIISIVSYVVVLVAAIKIYKIGNVAGSGKVLIFLIGSIIVTLLSILFLYNYEGSESFIFEDAIELVLSLFMAIGAYGFFEMAKYLKNINK